MVRVERGIYKLSDGEYKNLIKISKFGSTEIYDKEEINVVSLVKNIVDNLTVNDINRALRLLNQLTIKKKIKSAVNTKNT